MFMYADALIKIQYHLLRNAEIFLSVIILV